MTNQPCPYTCSNKNTAGYCQSTVCIKPYSITYLYPNKDIIYTEQLANFNVLGNVCSIPPDVHRFAILQAALPELKEEYNHIRELFDLAWDCNMVQHNRTELSQKTTDYLSGVIQTMSYLIQTLEDNNED